MAMTQIKALADLEHPIKKIPSTDNTIFFFKDTRVVNSNLDYSELFLEDLNPKMNHVIWRWKKSCHKKGYPSPGWTVIKHIHKHTSHLCDVVF